VAKSYTTKEQGWLKRNGGVGTWEQVADRFAVEFGYRRTNTSLQMAFSRFGFKTKDNFPGLILPDAAAAIGMSIRWVELQIRKGTIHTLRYGNFHVIPHEDVAVLKAKYSMEGYLSMQEAAKYVGVPRYQMDAWWNKGVINAEYRGTRVAIKPEEAERIKMWRDARIEKAGSVR
jgi:hypothetical protein